MERMVKTIKTLSLLNATLVYFSTGITPSRSIGILCPHIKRQTNPFPKITRDLTIWSYLRISS